MGWMVGMSEDEDKMVVMVHPPETVTDLTLEDFVVKVIEANNQGIKRGMKLDFKSEQACKLGFPVLKKLKDQMNFPVLINADLVVGPCFPGCETYFDPDMFLPLFV